MWSVIVLTFLIAKIYSVLQQWTGSVSNVWQHFGETPTPAIRKTIIGWLVVEPQNFMEKKGS
jgi:hypothetical protein